MEIEKYLISLEPISFERIDDYLDCIKELQLKLGDRDRYFSKKDGQLIELVLMNLKTPYDVLFSSFQDYWISCKQYCKDFTYDTLCDLLIKDQQKLLEEGKLGGKN